MAVTLMKVSSIEPKGPFSVFGGVVQHETLRTGQTVVAVSKGGERDLAMIIAVVVNDGGPRLYDEGPPGRAVQITLRRKAPSFPDATLDALEKAEVA